MKKILLYSLFILLTYSCSIKNPNFLFSIKLNSATNVPADPMVKIGTLENGLTYYVRSNSKPENRAEMLLVVNAGSVLEEESQQGLAHFLEHMAFNGTKNFPKQDLVDYLESIGLDFGPDLNAYTSFDETVYMLQVPTDDHEKMDKAFQILADWGHNLTLDGEEIDKERGVVIEEWRLGQGADMRMINKQLPVMLKDSKYASRLPIGQKAVLDTFKYSEVRKFYDDWYKPELMAVIAVGDFNDESVVKLIKKHFSIMKKSISPKIRPQIKVPDHDETLFAIASDPEASYSSVSIMHKFDNEEDKLSLDAFRKGLVFNLYNGMLSNRLDELTKLAEPPFLFAYSSNRSWVLSKQMYTLGAYVKTNGILNGLEGLLTEVLRLQKHGFTETELNRQKTVLLRNMEKLYNEKDKTESKKYKWDYKDNFMKGHAIPSIEFLYEESKKLLPMISLVDVNEMSNKIISNENRVITASSPENGDIIIPNDNDLKEIFKKVVGSEILPYVDVVSTEPLVADFTHGGSVEGEKIHSSINVTEWTLSNGVKVILKPTDFKNDEILFYAHSPGGTSLVMDSDYISAQTSVDLISESGLGNFNKIELDKLLSDKIVGVSPWIDELNEGFQGNASPQDIEVMLQLIYKYFNESRSDSTAFMAYKARMEGWIENRTARPENVYRDSIQITKSQHHFRARPWTMEMLNEMNLERSHDIFKDRFSDAGDFTFFFVGSFDLDVIKPLIEKYLGSLLNIDRNESWNDIDMRMPKGIVENTVKKGLEPKSMVHLSFNGEFDWSIKNKHLLKSLESVMEIKLREIMREDMGGTYGVWMWSIPKHYPREEYEFNIVFGCSPENVDTLSQALFLQIDSLKTYGIDADYVSKVQEKQKQSREVDLKENKFWLEEISSYYFHGLEPSQIIDYGVMVDDLSVSSIQQAAIDYLNTNNYVKVVLYPESID